MKKNKMESLINNDLDLSSSDESDSEFDNGSDNRSDNLDLNLMINLVKVKTAF